MFNCAFVRLFDDAEFDPLLFFYIIKHIFLHLVDKILTIVQRRRYVETHESALSLALHLSCDRFNRVESFDFLIHLYILTE